MNSTLTTEVYLNLLLTGGMLVVAVATVVLVAAGLFL